jgi:hypothetical protein
MSYIFHKRGTCFIERDMLKMFVSGLEIEKAIFITEQEILDQLKILNVNKPAGPDGVSPRLLKDIAFSISKPLTNIFNMSLSIKQVPLLWKI